MGHSVRTGTLWFFISLIKSFTCIIQCVPWKRRKAKYLQERIQSFLQQCPVSFKERPSVFHVIDINGGVLPSPSHIPAHVSGGKRVLKKKLGWWEELNAFCLLQIGSPLTYADYSYSPFSSKCLSTSGNRKVNHLLKLIGQTVVKTLVNCLTQWPPSG